ncbi:hypothetical protein OC845_003786 [Tilletia horrida]|nr:hypothetical protein OC845_003786 [Tilletia horrida]
MPLQGACLCKAIKVEVADEFLPLRVRSLSPLVRKKTTAAYLGPALFAMCYCQNCATSHSAPGCLVAGMLTKFLKVTGTPSTYRDVDTDSGKAVIRAFCGTCGTPIRSWPEHNTDVTALRAGLFAKTNQDGTAEAAAGNSGFVYPAPISELYTERRNHQFPWVAPQDGAKEWPRMEKFE